MDVTVDTIGGDLVTIGVSQFESVNRKHPPQIVLDTNDYGVVYLETGEVKELIKVLKSSLKEAKRFG